MSRMQLICFPHAGGGGQFFRPWRDQLGPEIEVLPVVLPGRETRWQETPLTSMDEVVRLAMRELGAKLGTRFAFFGHSLGAAVAYELARRHFSEPGSGLAQLFVSARRAPHAPMRQVPAHALSRDEFLGRVRVLNGIPDEVMADRDLMDTYLPCLRADFAVNETYAPTRVEQLPVPVTAFIGQADPAVGIAEMLRWKDTTAARFSLRVFSGDHFYLKGGRADLYTAIATELEQAAQLSVAQNWAEGRGPDS